jgi:hypothetical protein
MIKKLLVIFIFLVSLITVNARNVMLIWSANDPREQVKYYNIYEKVGTKYILKKTNIVQTKVTLFNVNSKLHIYVATAINFWGESTYSNQVLVPKI